MILSYLHKITVGVQTVSLRKEYILMRAYLKKMLGLVTAGTMTLTALPVITAQAKDVSSMTPKEIAADMGMGWNLGNSLDSHNSKTHGKLGLNAETLWGNPKTTKALIDTVKAKGFHTIRVPVTWYPHADENYKIDSAWMNRVKQVVDWCIDEDTYVILNIHHEEWNTPTDANYEKASAELKSFWEQIATEFESYDRHLIFEGMNEPRNYGGAHEWDGGTPEMREVVNKLDKDFVDTVRATGGKNKTRCLMVPTYAASSTYVAMNALNIPDDPNVMVSVHAYTPYNFTMNTGKGGTSKFDSNQENSLKQLFKDINNIYLSKGYAVVIGEFSASNKENTDERVKWAKSFAEQAKEKGIPLVLWDNNSPKDTYNNGEGHGYLNRKALEWYSDSEPVVNKLISTYYGTDIKDDPVDPAGKGETIYKGELSASGWTPSDAVAFDFTKMKEGSYIAVTYDTKGVAPTLIIQDDDPWKVWAKVTPDSLMSGVAYYSYSDIVSAYAADYNSKYGKDPSAALDNAFQMFISAENNGDAGATKIEYIPPKKDENKTIDISDCKVILDPSSFTYDGKEHKPSVKVTYGTLTLTEGTDYTVTYQGGKEIGDAYVTVTAAGKYTGSVKVKFTIDPSDISGYKLGDVNFDGVINVSDITAAAAHVKGVSSLSDSRCKAADVNEDTTVNVSDISMIAAHVKSRKSLPDKTLA